MQISIFLKHTVTKSHKKNYAEKLVSGKVVVFSTTNKQHELKQSALSQVKKNEKHIINIL